MISSTQLLPGAVSSALTSAAAGAVATGRAASVAAAGDVIAAGGAASRCLLPSAPPRASAAGASRAQRTRRQPPGGYAAAPRAAETAIAKGGATSKTTDSSGTAATTSASRTSASTPSASTAGASKTTGSKTTASKTSASKTASPLAFLSDSKLSVEEKLFRFMLYVADTYEKDLEKKLKELAGKSSSSSSGGSKKSSFLSKVRSVIKQAVPGLGFGIDLLQQKEIQALLKQVSGPVLAAGATALGFPQLAPVLASAGPEIAAGLIDVAKTLDSEDQAPASGSGSTSTSSPTSGAGELPDKKEMLELQHLVDKEKEMFSLVSNVLRSMHDTRMSVINNVRA